MNKKAVTHSTLLDLIGNSSVRTVSPAVQEAWAAANAASSGKCSACAKRKQASDAAANLLTRLRGASDAEIDRIKRALGVDKLVFQDGMSFIER